jgi:diamine N-acetyltransferase
MSEIRPVTIANWRELSKLKVRDDQAHLVASNLHSIAESKFGHDHPVEGHWDMTPYGIYDGETPVGFLLLGYNFSNAPMQGFVIRLMVDAKVQNRGYGKFAMNWALEHFRADQRVDVVGISYEPENEIARRLYASMGFVETNEIVDGEVTAKVKLRP